IPRLQGEVAALNLFAYSGIGSMVMAQAGARVTHLDAARGMNDWGRENRELNADLVPDAIRWICDDVKKFVGREIRRGSKYNCIALDPPTFGRGSKGQVWKIEDDLPELLESCRQLRDESRDFLMVLSCHSPGYSPLTLQRMLTGIFGEAETVAGEMTIPENGKRLLPAGIFARLILRV
ncbi:MAG: class I SAM-dependent methyltransferase, partial [Victivallales bacterium]|nr:class I SAM-dependent methyltransferase [Victivallales bacterium]